MSQMYDFAVILHARFDTPSAMLSGGADRGKKLRSSMSREAAA